MNKDTRVHVLEEPMLVDPHAATPTPTHETNVVLVVFVVELAIDPLAQKWLSKIVSFFV